jgi:hypothetical protein
VGGAPLRPRLTACILARMSGGRLTPLLPRLAMVGALGRGFRAALMLPSGVDEKLMFGVGAPDVDSERTAGRSGESREEDEGGAGAGAGAGAGVGEGETSAVGLEESGGEDGEGVSKPLSESLSPSGVDAADAMVEGGRGAA